MDTQSSHRDGNFTYDPSIYGLSLSYWVQVVGSGAATTGSGVSTKIRLNADRIASMVCYRFVDASFFINVPVAPTAGDVRRWGFSIPGGGNRGRVGFDITDTDFKAVVYDNDGTLLASETLTWDASYTATETKFRLAWYRGGVEFYIGTTRVAKLRMAGNAANTTVPTLPCPIDINNANSDNMDVGVIILKDISSWN